jgi:1,4-dihydroxy-2-naphthoate octaprenyltransferase
VAHHLAGVLLDNHELLRLHATVPAHPELLEARADRRLALTTLRWAIAGSIVAGGWLLGIGGFAAVMTGAPVLVVSLGYAGPSLAYAVRGWADPVFLLSFGVLAVLGAWEIQALRS